jgi:hypothetical protein
MKIIITESKLHQAVIDYLNEKYDIDNINWTYSTDDWGNEMDYAMMFYMDDFEDDENLFKWYDKGYWESDDMSNIDRETLDKWIEDSPILSFDDTDTLNTLNGYFGDRWYQPFKDWFLDNFNLPIKTIE